MYQIQENKKFLKKPGDCETVKSRAGPKRKGRDKR